MDKIRVETLILEEREYKKGMDDRRKKIEEEVKYHPKREEKKEEKTKEQVTDPSVLLLKAMTCKIRKPDNIFFVSQKKSF
jgi:hypothetical protein